MLSRFSPHAVCLALFITLALTCAPRAAAQDTDEFGDAAADPVKLFNQGQDAHAKKEYERAVEFYEEALKLKPEFAEAEFQKGAALVALKRKAEAEKSYRRAMELKPTWALPPAALGLLLVETPGREREAEPFLRRALELDAKNLMATIALAELRSRAGDAAESATFWRRATELKTDDASLWVARAHAELSAKDSASAAKSFGQAISIEPANVEARLGRADLALASNDKARAVEDLRALEEQSKNDWKLAAALANRYGLAGQTEDARRVYETLPEEAKNSDAGRKLLAALSGARCEENAAALSCLGTLTRTTDPQRSLELFKRALDISPRNVDYAVGYAAALNQLRRFEDAATVLQRVLQVAPDKYEAHANLAAALYELKLYKQAIVEYKWVGEARPELAVVHYFIATALDRLGEYEDALAAYETFLARADARTNELEIEKVSLRLPSLRNQIKRGEGVKKDKKAQ
jgi:superkiller protein 3